MSLSVEVNKPSFVAQTTVSAANNISTQSTNFGQSTIAPAVENPFLAPVSALSQAFCVGKADIRLIDLDAIQNATGAERTKLIAEFGDALKEVGFLAVRTSPVFTDLIDSANQRMKSYFGQSIETKMRDWHDNNGQTGFSPQGNETAAGAKKPDIKETYFVPPNYTRWPKGESQKEFEPVMKLYHSELTKIAAQVMGFIAEYLEETTEPVAQSMEAAGNLLRLAYYPAPKSTDDPAAVWAAAHEDLNALTLLPPSEVPGLQLLSKEGEWLSVNAPKGYLIVNTGEQVELKTAGLIKATRHQVLNPGVKTARYSTPFFASWSDQFSLKPFQSCMDKMTVGMSPSEKEAYEKKFPNVNTNDNLMSRLIEMGAIPNPSEEFVRDLRSKGLLQKPPANLVERFPFLSTKV